MKKTLEILKSELSEKGTKYLMIAYSDIHGLHKGRVIPINRLDFASTSGPAFTGGSVPGAGQTPQHPEMVARADFETCTPMSWLPQCAHFMASLEVQGKPHPYCPRGNLQRVLKDAESLGYRLNMGVELEHYIVTHDDQGVMHPWNPQRFDGAGMPGYNLNAMIPALPYLTTMIDHFNDLGWGVYQVDHEDGPSQWEINFEYKDALTTCDRAMYFRLASRQIAKQQLGKDVHVTFLAKPFPSFCGSGAHIHYHLADAETGKRNLFLDLQDTRKLGLSKLAYHFIGGIFKHAQALCAIINPSPNCYERLHPIKTPDSGNPWTPANILYSDDNRTGMIRVPEPGHCEDRAPSGACNLYLAAAAYIAAGIDGIDNNLDPGEPFFGNAFENTSAPKLPKNLAEALTALSQDQVVCEALGPIADEFQKMKKVEIEKWEDAAWKKTSYLNFV